MPQLQASQSRVAASDRIMESAADVIQELASLSKKQILSLSEDGDMGFSEEFDRIRMVGELNYTDEASNQENRSRNRYRDVLPFNENRVVLEDGGYINASFLQVRIRPADLPVGHPEIPVGRTYTTHSPSPGRSNPKLPDRRIPRSLLCRCPSEGEFLLGPVR